MADLDYAFLADYARVEPNGTLTSLGASWTFLQVTTLPASHRMAVAGRVRAAFDDPPTPVSIEAVVPDDSFKMRAETELQSSPASHPYGAEAHVGRLFALELQLPLPSRGLYTVSISIEGAVVRELKFEVVGPDGP